MKKITFLILFTLLSWTVFANGLTGIFGIDFGTNSENVKKLMSEKGWNLSKTDGTTLIYKKTKGTYASLIVDEIKIYFYEDKFYDVFITFPINTKTDDIISAVKAIQESCELKYVNNEETSPSGIDILMYSYKDPNFNTFNLIVMGSKSISMSTFELTDFKINSEKNDAENKIKEEETARKNKSISSDL